MAQNFIRCDRDQDLLMAPSLRDWLPERHLAWCVIDAVAVMDLTTFYGAYRQDGHGRAAHDPSMMVALLLYSYAVGVRSSRCLERRCVEDVPTRVICANLAPDHTTIARFRQLHEIALGEVFGEVLGLCAEAGLVSLGLIAIDGTKFHADASHHATRGYEQIAREILAEADAVDDAENERLDGEQADEPAPQFASGPGRRAWMRDAKQRLDARRAAEAQPSARSRPQRLKQAKQRLEEDHAAEIAANAAYEAHRERGKTQAGRHNGRPPAAYLPTALPAGKINITDLDSRNVKAPRGWVQGYNAQAVCTREQIVIAAEVTLESPDFGHLEPMLDAALAELQRAGIEGRPEVVVADTGYWHNEQLDSIAGRGMQVLMPPEAGKRKGTRPGWDSGRYVFMRRVLATDYGAAIYAQRQSMIEPLFGDTKFNRRIDRFQRRGRSACRSEWRLITASQNLRKLWRHQLAATAA
jgi:transposase